MSIASDEDNVDNVTFDDSWTDREEEPLIDSVRNEELLWKKSSENYSRQGKLKDLAWGDIARKVGRNCEYQQRPVIPDPLFGDKSRTPTNDVIRLLQISRNSIPFFVVNLTFGTLISRSELN